MSLRFISIAAALLAGALLSSTTLAAPPPPGTIHVRGTIKTLSGSVLTVATAGGPVSVTLPAKPAVVSVLPSDRGHIKPGSFLGIASVPGPGGAQRAREVVVFPEAARGTGEGSYAWDLPSAGGMGHSKMTNGTVSHSRMTNGTAMRSRMTNGTVKSASSGGALTLTYKNSTGTGSQVITLPPSIPVVTFGPGTASQLVPGAHVVVFGHKAGSGVAADRVLVGKSGLVPPM